MWSFDKGFVQNVLDVWWCSNCLNSTPCPFSCQPPIGSFGVYCVHMCIVYTFVLCTHVYCVWAGAKKSQEPLPHTDHPMPFNACLLDINFVLAFRNNQPFVVVLDTTRDRGVVYYQLIQNFYRTDQRFSIFIWIADKTRSSQCLISASENSVLQCFSCLCLVS